MEYRYKKIFTGDVLVRIDAHSSVPKDFIEKNVRNIEAGEDVSGGKRPNIIDDDTGYKIMLLEAESSMFGSGIAPFRNASGKKYVKLCFTQCIKEKYWKKSVSLTKNC